MIKSIELNTSKLFLAEDKIDDSYLNEIKTEMIKDYISDYFLMNIPVEVKFSLDIDKQTYRAWLYLEINDEVEIVEAIKKGVMGKLSEVHVKMFESDNSIQKSIHLDGEAEAYRRVLELLNYDKY